MSRPAHTYRSARRLKARRVAKRVKEAIAKRDAPPREYAAPVVYPMGTVQSAELDAGLAASFKETKP